LGDGEAFRGQRNLNPEKIVKGPRIRHEELFLEAGLNKGNILRIIASDDHVVNK
jgi:hypothetical protein